MPVNIVCQTIVMSSLISHRFRACKHPSNMMIIANCTCDAKPCSSSCSNTTPQNQEDYSHYKGYETSDRRMRVRCPWRIAWFTPLPFMGMQKEYLSREYSYISFIQRDPCFSTTRIKNNNVANSFGVRHCYYKKLPVSIDVGGQCLASCHVWTQTFLQICYVQILSQS
jgi:hypothetical protein